MSKPTHVNPVQWSQAVGYARQSCARVYRKGGSPRDAANAFGVAGRTECHRDWDWAVRSIAMALCAPGQRI